MRSIIKKIFPVLFLVHLLLVSCTSKKDIIYFQDAERYNESKVSLDMGSIQPNDILSIDVEALLQESAIAYNAGTANGANNQMMNIEVLKLKGYLVDVDGTIKFPVLGKVSVKGLSFKELELRLEALLRTGGHLVSPKVRVRLLNAKVTVLGEVNSPGTYTFTEQFITLPQALGYAGDLTINGKRDEILLIREENGIRQMHQIDLTKTKWLSDPIYSIRQNDVIVVNPNRAKVKSAGLVGNTGTVLTIFSLMLTSVVLLTR